MDEIISPRGSVFLPLSRRRRDALAEFCRIAAEKAGKPPQQWVRETFNFTIPEAKEVLKANASEALFERMVQHPRGGWRLLIPIMGAVIGQSLEDHINNELRGLEHEAQERQRRAQQLAATEAFLRGSAVVSVGRGSRPAGGRLRRL